MTNPRVLMLDEPTEGIQPSIIKDISRSLREIRKLRKLTIVVTEQVLSFVLDTCDSLMVIERAASSTRTAGPTWTPTRSKRCSPFEPFPFTIKPNQNNNMKTLIKVDLEPPRNPRTTSTTAGTRISPWSQW